MLRFSLPWLLLLSVSASSAGAQQSSAAPKGGRLTAIAVAGASQFDLSGTGTTLLMAARLDGELRPWLLAEGSLGYMNPKLQFGAHRRYFIPEAQLQLQLASHRVHPYLGAGAGVVWSSGDGGTDSDVTLSGSAGVRAPLVRDHLDLRAELRVRGIGTSFSGAAAEWSAGVGYRF